MTRSVRNRRFYLFIFSSVPDPQVVRFGTRIGGRMRIETGELPRRVFARFRASSVQRPRRLVAAAQTDARREVVLASCRR
jgi:hypothetical protein